MAKYNKTSSIKEGKVVKVGKTHDFKVPKGFTAAPHVRLKGDGSVSKSTWIMLKPIISMD